MQKPKTRTPTSGVGKGGGEGKVVPLPHNPSYATAISTYAGCWMSSRLPDAIGFNYGSSLRDDEILQHSNLVAYREGYWDLYTPPLEVSKALMLGKKDCVRALQSP